MIPEKIRELLDQVEQGTVSSERAFQQLKNLPYEEMGFATLDNHRQLRQGVPEVIYCQNKLNDEIISIAQRLQSHGHSVLGTRIQAEALEELKQALPEAMFYDRSRCFVMSRGEIKEGVGHVVVICAGTSDLPVAEEAAVTARYTGSKVTQLSDVGVAGIHRLLGRLDLIRTANAIVVVAGMEGALPSVVGGLVEIPVIAVPTSVGYGANFGGISALLTMLNSCSAGVSVVNIDNGFGAGYAASLINRRICEGKQAEKQEEAQS